MAQDGPHDHHDLASTNEHSFVTPTTLTFLGPAENHEGGSRVHSPAGLEDASNKGKEIALQDGEEDGSSRGDEANADRSKGKEPATGRAATDATEDGFLKGKGSPAAENEGDLKAHIITERERRKRMKDLFSNLQALMPHVAEKVDKATLVGETIHFIRVLEQTKAQLEKKKQEQALARQAAALATMSSMSAPLLTAQGMAVMSNGWGHVPRQQPLVATTATPPQPPLLAAATGPVGFQTWSAPNVVLSVSNNKGIINLCLPKQPRMLTVIMSVLNKHAVDVITAHVAADGGRSLMTIYACVNAPSGENLLAEDIFKLAVSEIMVWLSC